MASTALPISSLINATVNLSPAAAQAQNLSSLLILGSSAVIDVNKRIRSYTSLAQVANDFGTSADEYLAAVLWFEQAPQPSQLFIGRWAKTASSGQLIGAPLSAAQQALALWTAVTNGGVNFTIDGVARNLTGLNFSGVTNLNGVASAITAALLSGSPPVQHATCVWNGSSFVITSATTGASSTVAFAAAGSGTDISAMLGMLATSSGAYVANGIAAETALSAVTLFDQQFGQQWYAVAVVGAADSDKQAVSAYIEAATNEHFYGVSTQEAGVIVSGDTADIAYLLAQTAPKKTAVQFSSTTLHSAASLLGRILTTDWNANNTAITLMYKQEPGIVPETLTPSQLAAALAKNCNVFASYDNNTAIIQPGVSAGGQYIDTVIGTAWLKIAIQNALFNMLYQSPTKIPQTDAGMHMLCTAVEQVCAQAVANGLVAPGVWTANGFGALKPGDFMAKGYYVYAAPISTQSASDRAARKAVPIQVAIKLGGAVHTASVAITVNS